MLIFRSFDYPWSMRSAIRFKMSKKRVQLKQCLETREKNSITQRLNTKITISVETGSNTYIYIYIQHQRQPTKLMLLI